MTSSPVTSCLNILQSTNPSDRQENVKGLSALLNAQDRTELHKSLNHVVPLEVANDPNADDRPFVISMYNRGSTNGTYRSPWTNIVYIYPSLTVDSTGKEEESTRSLEQHANEVWKVYTDMYFGENAVGSVYLWSEGDSLRGSFLVTNTAGDSQWNSSHVVQIVPSSEKQAKYIVNSCVWIVLKSENNDTKVWGVANKTASKITTYDSSNLESHVENVGPLIESVEGELRSNVQSVYLPQSIEVAQSLRRKGGDTIHQPMARRTGTPTMGGGAHAALLNQAILARKLKKANI